MHYPTRVHRETHPARLAAVATLYGLNPPVLRGARVLDVGCATGVNLLAFDACGAGFELVGIDVSDAMIGHGRALATEAGIEADLRVMDLRDAPSLGRFDFVIAHGVYSWVPDPAREALMGALAALLTDDGLAFVSFNAMPGWGLRGIAAEALRMGARTTDDPDEAVRRAKQMLAMAADNAPGPLAPILRDELALVADADAGYVWHEYLVPGLKAFWVSEVMDHAAAHGLHHVGDARFHTEQLGIAARRRPDVPEVQQLLDLARGRAFRRSILARRPPQQPSPDRVRSLSLVSWMDGTTLPDGRDAGEAVDALNEVRPEAVPAAGFDPVAVLRLADHGGIDLLSGDLRYAPRLEPPVVSPLARALAARGERLVPGVLGNQVELAPADLAIVPGLDGSRDSDRAAVYRRAGLLIGGAG